MSTANYLIAHRALPIQAGSQPKAVWDQLSGSEWSTWLAMIGKKLEVKVRHIGIEGMAEGKPIVTLDGFEMIFMYFPKPEESGEPYYAVIAREVGQTKLRSFVFERGSTTPEEPVRVVMAEWKYEGPDNVSRMRFDATANESLEACIERTVEIMIEGRNRSPATGAGNAASGSLVSSEVPAARRGMRVVLIGIGVLVAVVAVFVLSKM